MREPDPASRRVHPRLELPEADFIALKAHAARQHTTLARLVEAAVVAWLAGDAAPPAAEPLVRPVVRYTVALPEELHTRLKVQAAYGRTTMQVLMRAALAPVLTEAQAEEADDRRAGLLRA